LNRRSTNAITKLRGVRGESARMTVGSQVRQVQRCKSNSSTKLFADRIPETVATFPSASSEFVDNSEDRQRGAEKQHGPCPAANKRRDFVTRSIAAIQNQHGSGSELEEPARSHGDQACGSINISTQAFNRLRGRIHRLGVLDKQASLLDYAFILIKSGLYQVRALQAKANQIVQTDQMPQSIKAAISEASERVLATKEVREYTMFSWAF